MKKSTRIISILLVLVTLATTFTFGTSVAFAEEHNYVGTVTNPTCTTMGYTTYTCTNCSSKYVSDFTPATGHKYATTVVPSTCDKKGYTEHKCSACGDTYTDTFTDAIGHKYTNVVVTAPTCTTDGYTTYTCTNCGKTYTDNKVVATGHKYTVTSYKKATTSANGERVSVCSTCGDKKVETFYKPKYIRLSQTRFIYSHREVQPTVVIVDSKDKLIDSSNYTIKYSNNKYPGKATAKITFKSSSNYSGTMSATYIIAPKTQMITSISSTKTKKIRLSWCKDSTVTGYKVAMSTTSNFKSGKTNYYTIKNTSDIVKIFSNLKKGKKYYFKVRSYKTVGKTTYYGDYSKSKSIKCS